MTSEMYIVDYQMCIYARTFVARIWHIEWHVKINSKHLKGKNMGITLSFIFCLLSGFACFWLFWKCIDWFENI